MRQYNSKGFLVINSIQPQRRLSHWRYGRIKKPPFQQTQSLLSFPRPEFLKIASPLLLKGSQSQTELYNRKSLFFLFGLAGALGRFFIAAAAKAVFNRSAAFFARRASTGLTHS